MAPNGSSLSLRASQQEWSFAISEHNTTSPLVMSQNLGEGRGITI